VDHREDDLDVAAGGDLGDDTPYSRWMSTWEATTLESARRPS
jgi:hypothetical protein